MKRSMVTAEITAPAISNSAIVRGRATTRGSIEGTQ